jgi:hypothetical protein
MRCLQTSMPRKPLCARRAPEEKNQMAQSTEFKSFLCTQWDECVGYLSAVKFLLKAGKWWGRGRGGGLSVPRSHSGARRRLYLLFLSLSLRLRTMLPAPREHTHTHMMCSLCARCNRALLFIIRTPHWDKDSAELWIRGWFWRGCYFLLGSYSRRIILSPAIFLLAFNLITLRTISFSLLLFPC